MAKQLLIETYHNANPVLLESTAHRPGCIGQFELVCCDYSNDTENGRFYSERLWENCSKEGSKMATRIKDKRAFGELDHPDDRLDSRLACSAVNLVKFEKDEANKTYKGIFDILDTPYGKMVKTYLEYGSKIGVSSRGAGDISVKEGRQCVDEDTYDWEAFDVVLDPAVSKSKANMLESKQAVDNLNKSLLDIINESTDPYELKLMRKLIENTNVPERDSILESIDNKLSSDDSEGGATLSQLMEDLEKSTGNVAILESEKTDLTKKLSASTTRVSVLESTVSSLKTANKRLRLTVTRTEKTFTESTQKLNNELSLAKSTLEVREDQISRLQTENASLRNKLSVTEAKLSAAEKSLNESNQKLSESKETLTESTSSLRTQLKKFTDLNESHISKITKLEETVATLKKTSASILSNYIRKVAQYNSLDEKELANKVKVEGKMTCESVDAIVESMRSQSDRLSILPFEITKGAVVTESIKKESDPELLRAQKFAKNLSRNKNN